MEEDSVKEDDFTVFIGQKELNTYVFSVKKQSETFDRILIKARGMSINKAVDVSQIALEEFLKEWKITNVELSTDLMPYKPRHYEDPNTTKEDQKISKIVIELAKSIQEEEIGGQHMGSNTLS